MTTTTTKSAKTTATTAKTTATARKAATTKSTPAKTVKNTQAEQQVEVKETPQRNVRAQIDRNTEVPVRSATRNSLLYISKKTHERVEWGEIGDVQFMTVDELMSMKSSQRRFLDEAWVIIDDEAVVEYLGLTKLYDKLFDIGDVDSILDLPAYELEQKLQMLPKGYKKAVAGLARDRIANDEMDSIKKVNLVEKYLDVDLQTI